MLTLNLNILPTHNQAKQNAWWILLSLIFLLNSQAINIWEWKSKIFQEQALFFIHTELDNTDKIH